MNTSNIMEFDHWYLIFATRSNKMGLQHAGIWNHAALYSAHLLYPPLSHKGHSHGHEWSIPYNIFQDFNSCILFAMSTPLRIIAKISFWVWAHWLNPYPVQSLQSHIQQSKQYYSPSWILHLAYLDTQWWTLAMTGNRGLDDYHQQRIAQAGTTGLYCCVPTNTVYYKCFQLTHFSCDVCENMCILSYHP